MIIVTDRQPEPQAATGTITSSLGGGVYLVRDVSGRTHRAEAATPYSPGQRVVLIGKQITGRAGRKPATITIEV